MPTVKDMINHLDSLKDEYDGLRANIADDFNDNWIDIALPKIEKLLKLRECIEVMENFDVKVNSDSEKTSNEQFQRKKEIGYGEKE